MNSILSSSFTSSLQIHVQVISFFCSAEQGHKNFLVCSRVCMRQTSRYGIAKTSGMQMKSLRNTVKLQKERLL